MLYLQDLVWDDPACAEHVLTVLRYGTVQGLQETYLNNRKWRKEIRDAILHCLHVLSECCVDSANGDFSIPWISESSDQLAIFSRRELSWTGFLQDTRDTCSFGLLVNKCLAFSEKGGRPCGHYQGKPVLKTSLHINQNIKDNYMKLKQRPSGDYFWSISALHKKYRFPLGSRGSLTALKVLRGALLMQWNSEASIKSFLKMAFKWNGGMHHQEYIPATWNAKHWPIRIFIETKHKLPLYQTGSKEHGPGRSTSTSPIAPPPARSIPPIIIREDNTSSRLPSEIQPTEGFYYSEPIIRRGDNTSLRFPPQTQQTEGFYYPAPIVDNTSSRLPPQTQQTEGFYYPAPIVDDTSSRLPSQSQPTEGFDYSEPITFPQDTYLVPREEDTSSDLGIDDSNVKGGQNGWKWDKKYKLWRRHVFTDGELDYTTWSRNPDLSDT